MARWIAAHVGQFGPGLFEVVVVDVMAARLDFLLQLSLSQSASLAYTVLLLLLFGGGQRISVHFESELDFCHIPEIIRGFFVHIFAH